MKPQIIIDRNLLNTKIKPSIGEILAIISLFALFLSIIFSFGLSFGVDHPLYKHLGLVDFTKLGIIFLVPAGLGFTLNIPFFLFGIKQGRKMENLEVKESSKKLISFIPQALLISMTIILSLSYMLFRDPRIIWVAMLPGLMYVYARIVLLILRKKKTIVIKRMFSFFVVNIPILIIVVFSLGGFVGSNWLLGSYKNIEVCTIKDTIYQGKYLFSSDEYVFIITDENNTLLVIPKSRVEKIESLHIGTGLSIR